MNKIILNKIIKKNPSLCYHYSNQYNKIRKIKIKKLKILHKNNENYKHKL